MQQSQVELWIETVTNLVAEFDSLRRASSPTNAGDQDPVSESLATINATDVKRILETFPDAVRYLHSRRSTPFASIGSEADVQDLLYLILKPSLPELQFETPTNKGSAGYSISDFYLKDLGMIIEAKYIGKTQDVKRIADEIAQDIWKYSTQTDCIYIVFFVYDPGLLIPDRQQFIHNARAESGSYVANGRTIEIETLVAP